MFKLAFLASLFLLAQAGVPWVGEVALTPWAPNGAAWWMQQHTQFVSQTKTRAAEIQGIFLGDSITAGWTQEGNAMWTQHFANRHVFNYGIPGDRTENVVWRIDNGEFDGLSPKVVVLMIGTNNIGANTNPDIAKGVKAIIDKLYTKMPSTHILLLSVLPRNTAQTDQLVHDLNTQLKGFADGQKTTFLDLMADFETGVGKQKLDLYQQDQLHLVAKGYETWYKAMEPAFAKLIA